MARRRTTKYLNNRDLLIEIHKSKTSYCSFKESKYHEYDAIVEDIAVLTDNEVCKEVMGMDFDDWIDEVIKKKVKKLNKEKDENDTTVYSVDDYKLDDLVFRFMTYEHIPENPDWAEEKEKKKPSDGFMKVFFPPFKHYIFTDDGLECVGMSHYDSNGNFDTDHGNITPKLGHMYLLLVEKISKKSNWRNYTYIDEMKSAALLQLSAVGLQFNEARGGAQLNPFAFYTTVVSNAFKRVLNTEKRVRDIRDDLLEMEGQAPSMTRQLETENADKRMGSEWSVSDYEYREQNKPRRIIKKAVSK